MLGWLRMCSAREMFSLCLRSDIETVSGCRCMLCTEMESMSSLDDDLSILAIIRFIRRI